MKIVKWDLVSTCLHTNLELLASVRYTHPCVGMHHNSNNSESFSTVYQAIAWFYHPHVWEDGSPALRFSLLPNHTTTMPSTSIQRWGNGKNGQYWRVGDTLSFGLFIMHSNRSSSEKKEGTLAVKRVSNSKPLPQQDFLIGLVSRNVTKSTIPVRHNTS